MEDESVTAKTVSGKLTVSTPLDPTMDTSLDVAA
jgi:hypothetical protein